MALVSPARISVQHISVPGALPAFLANLKGLPNNPASFYLSVNARSLVIYVAPASTVNIVNLAHLSTAIKQRNVNAFALKSFLETGKTVKVFFDAHTPAKILMDSCGIKLSNEVRQSRSYLHPARILIAAIRPPTTGPTSTKSK